MILTILAILSTILSVVLFVLTVATGNPFLIAVGVLGLVYSVYVNNR